MSKLTKSIIGITTALWLSGAIVLVPMTASAAALTTAQINSIVSMLQAFGADSATISNVQAALSGTPTTPVTPTTGYTFSAKLTLGSKGADVTKLQTVLKSDASVYPEGLVTGYFGTKTKAAVIKFQTKYGILPAAGYVGTLTNAKLNTLYGSGGTTPITPIVTPAGTGLILTAAVQPTATLAPGGAARVPFTKVIFTAGTDGDVVVSGVNVERTGLAIDANFAGVVLLDENGQQLGIAKTFNSDHKLIVGEPFTVKAGQSRTMTIAGNMAAKATLATYAGQVAYLSITGAVTSATVSGVLPITGAGQTINGTLTIGSLTSPTKGPTDPSANQSKEVGVTGYTFSSIKLTAGSEEKVRVKSVRWYQSGSIGTADLANLKTVTGGTSYDTVVSSDGKYYTSSFGDGIVIDKGGYIEAAIKGDVVGGSGRTVKFDVYKSTDIYATGETYGYGVTPPDGTYTCTSTTNQGQFCTTNPWYNAYTVTVSNGTINVQKATLVAAANIAVNLSNQTLGGFTVEVKGEPISVASMYFYVLTTNSAGTGQVADITNISLVDENGTVVAGPQDGTGAAVSGYVRFTDTVTFPIGLKTYTLKGKLGTDFGNNDTVTASTTPSTNWTTVTGQTTGNSITPSPTSAISANTMTVKSTSLAISVAGDPVAQTVIGGNRFTFANYKFDASASGEDIRMSTIPLAYYTIFAPTNLTSCKLYDGTPKANESNALTTGSNVINPTASASSTTFTFDGTGLTITKGTIKTISLSCSIAAATTTTSYYWGADSGATFSGTGLTSGQSFTPTATDAIGQLITVGTAGTFTVALDTANSPNYAVAAAGATGVSLSVLKFTSSNEAITLQKIALQFNKPNTSSTTDLVQVTLWAPISGVSTQIGTAVFTTTNFATSTLAIPVNIPKDSNLLVTVKGDLAAIGTSQPGIEGAWLAVDYDDDDPTGTQGIGASSGTTISRTTSADSASQGVRMFKSYPIFAKIPLTGSALTLTTGSVVPLYKFSVTATSPGNGIGIQKFTINFATSSGSSAFGSTTLYDLRIYAYDETGAAVGQGFTNGIVASTTSGYVTSAAIVAMPSSGNWFATTTNAVGTATIVQIPAGKTYTFKVTANNTLTNGTSGLSASVTTYLNGDTAYPGVTTMGVATGIVSGSKLVWSPNATTTSAAGNIDWTNGYNVSAGLPSTGMDSETLSK